MLASALQQSESAIHIHISPYLLPLASPSHPPYPTPLGGHCSFFFFFNFISLFLFLAVLGLRFCARAFSSCSKWGPLFIAVRGPLTIAASLVAEQGLQTHRLSNCGSRAQPLRSMWDLPRPGLEPASPALAGRLSTTAPPGKPGHCLFFFFSLSQVVACGLCSLQHVGSLAEACELSSCGTWA